MYLSSILEKPIINKSGESIGKVADVIVTNLNSPLPPIAGFLVNRGGRNHKDFFIPLHDCAPVDEKGVRLNTDVINFAPFERREDEIPLSRYMLDKQIVDIKERELTRINDIELSSSNGNLFLKNADVSFRALLGRLGLPTWGLLLKYNPIPWQDIQFLGVDLPVKVKIDYNRLETLHPADIAQFIFSGPGYRKGTQIIQSLEEDIAADVVESLPLELQVNLIDAMNPANAAKILSEMESHHAADLLAELSNAKAEDILKEMNQSQVGAVKELITYPDGSAGAQMKVEFVTASATMTVEELYKMLHDTKNLPEFLLYVYITENAASRKLVGVVSVWELFQASHRTRLETIMIKDYISVTPTESARKVLKKMTQYDLSALPVVNKHHHIIGIVTLTHAIKLLIPKSWQTRVSWRE